MTSASAKFFSGKGDDGQSSVMDGKRRFKDEMIFELLGAMDELSASLGLAVSFCGEKESDDQVKKDIRRLQEMLSEFMGRIAGAKKTGWKETEIIEWIEDKISQYGQGITTLAGFSFPGDSQIGAGLDLARTIARRVERIAVRYGRETGELSPQSIKLFNRLSSLVFVIRQNVEIRNNNPKQLVG